MSHNNLRETEKWERRRIYSISIYVSDSYTHREENGDPTQTLRTVFNLMLAKEVKKIKVFVKDAKLFFGLAIVICQQKIIIVKYVLLILTLISLITKDTEESCKIY